MVVGPTSKELIGLFREGAAAAQVSRQFGLTTYG
jgi:hypothetical protein